MSVAHHKESISNNHENDEHQGNMDPPKSKFRRSRSPSMSIYQNKYFGYFFSMC